jgi:hypothetical protein
MAVRVRVGRGGRYRDGHGSGSPARPGPCQRGPRSSPGVPLGPAFGVAQSVSVASMSMRISILRAVRSPPNSGISSRSEVIANSERSKEPVVAMPRRVLPIGSGARMPPSSRCSGTDLVTP